MKYRRNTIMFISIFLILTVLVYVNIVTGSLRIPLADIISVMKGDSDDPMTANVILNIRLPRIAAAIVLGGCLALSGYLLQTFFDNPIVGPFVLGISSGAKLTVALSLIFVMSRGRRMGSVTMVTAAFVGAMMAMGFVLFLSVRTRSMGVLVICGIMIGYICSAITDFVVTFADDSNIVNLHNWSVGSLSGMNWMDVMIMSIIALICLGISVYMSKPIGAYRLGEEYARSMEIGRASCRERV